MSTRNDLNKRQRAYLQAIFDTDQAIEADMRRLSFSPFDDRPKASEWRWMEYSEPIPEIAKPASRLYAAIKKTAKMDQGTVSTFDALADRGYIQVTVRGPDQYTHVRMRPAGGSWCAPGLVRRPTKHRLQARSASGTGGP